MPLGKLINAKAVGTLLVVGVKSSLYDSKENTLVRYHVRMTSYNESAHGVKDPGDTVIS